MQETEEVGAWFLGQGGPLEDGMAIPAWRIPWKEETGRL